MKPTQRRRQLYRSVRFKPIRNRNATENVVVTPTRSTMESPSNDESTVDTVAVLSSWMDPRRRNRWCGWCKKVRPETILLVCTLISVVLGSIIGLALNPVVSGGDHISARELMYLKFPGEIFMRSLQAMIVPMVISSNISAICSLNAKAARWLACMTMVYYVGTTFIAVVIGIILVLTIKPGAWRLKDGSAAELTPKSPLNVVDSILDVIRSLVPDNWVQATFMKSSIKFDPDPNRRKKYADKKFKDWKEPENFTQMFEEHLNLTMKEFVKRSTVAASGTNILGLIAISVFFGVAVRNLDKDAAVLAELFRAIRRAMVYLVSIVIWFSPIGIMCLIAAEIADTDDVIESVSQLYMYFTVMMTGLVIHNIVVLPTLLYMFTKRNPIQFAKNMLQALICAIGTASSTATLPCTIRCLESGNNIDPRVTRFMLPLAMYEAIAVIYIAQRMGLTLDFGDIVMVGITSMLASMAAASMPSAGLFTMAMVLTTVGLPPDRLAMIVPIDWFLDRFRTLTNVFSDSVGTAIVSALCEDHLNESVNEGIPLMPDKITEYPGGLTEIGLNQMEMGLAEPLHLEPNNNGHNNSNSTVKTPLNGQVPSQITPEITHNGSACVYVVDEETILLKF